MGQQLSARQQFDAIIEGVQQEATAAALALGFECKSKQKLVAALKRELDYWEREWCFDPDPDEYAAYPKSWARVVCVAIVRFLVEDIEQFIDDVDIRGGLDEIDENVNILRTRIGAAVRIKPRAEVGSILAAPVA